ncbi:hypothetical protein EON66_00335 [archaeon]|nr:MAG: hypothetical protein EON66_00335 [archaeon]
MLGNAVGPQVVVDFGVCPLGVLPLSCTPQNAGSPVHDGSCIAVTLHLDVCPLHGAQKSSITRGIHEAGPFRVCRLLHSDASVHTRVAGSSYSCPHFYALPRAQRRLGLVCTAAPLTGRHIIMVSAPLENEITASLGAGAEPRVRSELSAAAAVSLLLLFTALLTLAWLFVKPRLPRWKRGKNSTLATGADTSFGAAMVSTAASMSCTHMLAAVITNLSSRIAQCVRTYRSPVPATSASGVPCPPATSLLLLVNPRSGGGAGSRLMSVLQMMESPPEVHTLTSDGIHAAMRSLKVLRKSGGFPRLVCAGGDGTVTALIRTTLMHGLGAVPIAVLPLGTGNDCAQVLGSAAPSFTVPALTLWLQRVATARVVQTDVFDLSFDTQPGGSIVCVRDGVETQLAETSVRGTTALYTSVGLDARLVYTVELHRQRSRILNKMMYFLAGVWNIVATWPQPVSARIKYASLNGMGIDISRFGASFHSLIALCVPSYAGGTNLWRFAHTAPTSTYRRLLPPEAVCINSPMPAALTHASSNSVALEAAAQRKLLHRSAWAAWCQFCRRRTHEARDPWCAQASDDGAFELLTSATLVQEGATVGTQTGVWGGLTRLAQPASLSLRFEPPALPHNATTGASADVPLPALMSVNQQPCNGTGAAVSIDAASVVCATPPPRAEQPKVPLWKRPLTQLKTRTRRMRGRKQARLAQPELESEEEEGEEKEEDGEDADTFHDGQASYAHARSSDAEPPVAMCARASSARQAASLCATISPASSVDGHYAWPGKALRATAASRSSAPPTHDGGTGGSPTQRGMPASPGGGRQHVRGYALVPRGQVTTSRSDHDHASQSSPAVARAAPGRVHAAAPSSAGMKVAGSGASLDSRREAGTLEHDEDGQLSRNCSDRLCISGGSPAAASANAAVSLASGGLGDGSGTPLVVPQGGLYADTEPTFVQVDGESYKVFGLRSLDIAYKAKARLVSLAC